MKTKLASFVPATIVSGAIACIWLVIIAEEHFGGAGVLRRLEWLTFDWRARQAAQKPIAASTNLGFVFISDESIEALNNGTLDYRVGLYWPRYVYGLLVHELSEQHAAAVGFDVLFPDQRLDHTTNNVPYGFTSDGFLQRN